VDGDGLRCVVFLSGCNLRCGFCHNPETLYKKGRETDTAELISRILRYKAYIRNGGVTLSGGEPFLQKEFVIELCELLRSENINVCIETNGHIADPEIISAADSFIVDVKNQESLDADEYELFIETAVSLEKPIKLTNVIVPTVNDTEERLTEIKRLAAKIPESLFKGIKFLPFRKLCVGKYEKLGLEFPYASYREGERDDIALAMEIYKNI
jgi:pyruvate formate lyase activating enzyme